MLRDSSQAAFNRDFGMFGRMSQAQKAYPSDLQSAISRIFGGPPKTQVTQNVPLQQSMPLQGGQNYPMLQQNMPLRGGQDYPMQMTMTGYAPLSFLQKRA